MSAPTGKTNRRSMTPARPPTTQTRGQRLLPMTEASSIVGTKAHPAPVAVRQPPAAFRPNDTGGRTFAGSSPAGIPRLKRPVGRDLATPSPSVDAYAMSELSRAKTALRKAALVLRQLRTAPGA